MGDDREDGYYCGRTDCAQRLPRGLVERVTVIETTVKQHDRALFGYVNAETNQFTDGLVQDSAEVRRLVRWGLYGIWFVGIMTSLSTAHAYGLIGLLDRLLGAHP